MCLLCLIVYSQELFRNLKIPESAYATVLHEQLNALELEKNNFVPKVLFFASNNNVACNQIAEQMKLKDTLKKYRYAICHTGGKLNTSIPVYHDVNTLKNKYFNPKKKTVHYLECY